jgi:alpha-galactosidase
MESSLYREGKDMKSSRTNAVPAIIYIYLAVGICWIALLHVSSLAAQTEKHALEVQLDPGNGSYIIGAPGSSHPVLYAGVAVQLNTGWVQSKSYPRHTVAHSTVSDDLGTANEWTVTFSGLTGQPDLVYCLRAYPSQPFADIQVFVHNTTTKPIEVESIRPVAAAGDSILDLGGPASEDRVLSDSFSESGPNITIHDLSDAEIHRGVGSQMVYNRQSHESFFAGALTSDRFVTILRIHLEGSAGQKQIAAYEVDSTGTTELETGEWGSLYKATADDKVTLQSPVAPGEQLASERLLLSADMDYYRQLQTYGTIIRELHHARTTATTPMGWWSWAAYYFGLNAGTALTNAEWEAQNLKQMEYDFFFIDEGYQYARGEYTTPDATLFPNGLASLERKVTPLGLVPGIWTAPFEVSERSWVYENHPDWLVHNTKREPIHIGWVTDHNDRLFVLDCTNPGAQEYLRKTYSTLVHLWGIRYIKLDFMDDTAIEGYYYRPHTTAMEAQRIGLDIIRQTVGDKVLLDKDGSVMLNPVGYVDFGRISLDTGHTFGASRDAASGIAARYYMNRNYFVADPDAFTVSKQIVNDQSWHGGKRPLTLDEAEVSIALAAVSGGMYEIGDDLPTLGSEPERLALVQNQDLIDMVRLGRSSTPLDLMSYLPEDGQPSIFFLKESPRQSMLTIFNWTEQERTHTVTLASLRLSGTGSYTVDGVFDKNRVSFSESNPLVVAQPAHSVRIFKIINAALPARVPIVHAQHPSSGKTGETITFSAQLVSSTTPVVSYRWDFGDGVSLTGAQVSHAYTQANTYSVKLTAQGLDGLTTVDSFRLQVTGFISTKFVPAEKQRYRASRGVKVR